MANCTRCNTPLGKGTQFCPQCGLPIAQAATGQAGEQSQVRQMAGKAGKAVKGVFFDVKDAVTDIAKGSPSQKTGGPQQTPPQSHAPQPSPAQQGYPVQQNTPARPHTPAQAPPSQPTASRPNPLYTPAGQGHAPQAPPPQQSQPPRQNIHAQPQAAPQQAPHLTSQQAPAGGAYAPGGGNTSPAPGYQSQGSDHGMEGFSSRTWTGGTIQTPNGMQEPVVMQSKAQLSSNHHNLQDGNFVLTPTRIIWYKHGAGKHLLLGDWTHLTQGAYEFEIPLVQLHSVSVLNAAMWKYDTVYLYFGEPLTFCFNAMNHSSFTQALQRVVPGLMVVEATSAEQYHPNISEKDPRNPNGPRYQPGHARGYTLARSAQPDVTRAAVEQAKADGILAQDFELPDTPPSQWVLPPGIPVVVSLL